MNRYEAATLIAGIAQRLNQRISQLICNAADGEDIFYLTDEQLYIKCMNYENAYNQARKGTNG